MQAERKMRESTPDGERRNRYPFAPPMSARQQDWLSGANALAASKVRELIAPLQDEMAENGEDIS